MDHGYIMTGLEAFALFTKELFRISSGLFDTLRRLKSLHLMSQDHSSQSDTSNVKNHFIHHKMHESMVSAACKGKRAEAIRIGQN